MNIIAVLRYIDPCPGLPCHARRPLLAECRPEIMVFEQLLRYSPRRRASLWLAEGFSPTASAVERNKFSISIISVAAWGARYRAGSTSFTAGGVQSRPPGSTSVRTAVFRSPQGKRDVHCGRPRSVQPCPTGSTSVRTAINAQSPYSRSGGACAADPNPIAARPGA